MKIVSLQAENLKRLVAVEIRPDGNLVEITGKNGQGKTSVLDAIWWALTGAEHIQAAPIRKGETEARIRLDLGEIIVTRTFRRRGSDGETTTSLVVEGANGALFKSPQTMLDALLGELSFDPLAFARMKPREQFDSLKRFVPGIDFEGIANQNRGATEKRKELNRFAKQERAAAQAMVVPTGTPEEPIDEQALVAALSTAGEHNTAREGRRVRLEQAADEVKRLRENAVKAREGSSAILESITRRYAIRANEHRDAIAHFEEQLAIARANLVNLDKEREQEIAAKDAEIAETARKLNDEADALQARIDEAPPLAEPVDTEALRQRIDAARVTNAAVTRLQQRKQHEVRAENAEKQAQALTEEIDARNAAKQAAIAAATMPVAGIGFGDDQVLLNGVPFEQGSDAEQLQASVKIAAAMNPKLRVIRIRDGSLLDDTAMKNLAAFAAEQDMQIWVERVDSSGAIGFVIEDGHARKAAAVSTEEAVA